MNWAKVYPVLVALACVLVVIANTPAILTDPLATAVAQIRVNAAVTQLPDDTSKSSETTTSETSGVKKR